MSFEERNTWVYAIVALGGAIAYLVVVLVRSSDAPLAEVAYVAPMLWSIGGAVLAAVVGRVLISALWRDDAGAKDQRDVEIDQFGERMGQAFIVIGAIGGLVLAMLNTKTFWIANSIYFGFVLSAVIGSAAKLGAYREGLPR